jgi:hypothetical protein
MKRCDRIALLVSGSLLLAGAAAPDRGRPAIQSAAEAVPCGFSRVVLLASNSIELDRKVIVDGDVAVNEASAGPTPRTSRWPPARRGRCPRETTATSWWPTEVPWC